MIGALTSAAWTEECFSHKGTFWNFEDVAVVPKPIQKPHPKLFTGGTSNITYQIAGERGWGIFEPPFLPWAVLGGGWCPYCSLELKALQSVNAESEALGARLVAISPQVPDESLSTAEKNDLEFEVLSDVNSQVADQYGLTFSLDEDLRPVYKNWGADVATVNDDPDCKLPLPATYVISQDGKIVHSFVEEDYTERLEPDEILDSLRNLHGD